MQAIERFFRRLLAPSTPMASARLAWAAMALLLASAVLVVAAAAAMPPGYSWRFHTISESAAQGQLHGWIARLAFLSFGAGVFLLAVAARTHWARAAYWMQLVFALCMLGAAAFSHKPWMAGVASDEMEDFLHSVCASGMGFAFCAGVLARSAQRRLHGVAGRGLDVVVLGVAIVLPLLLASSSAIGGWMQRSMFALAYLWFGREALLTLGILPERKTSAA
jgi:hypothetical protein